MSSQKQDLSRVVGADLLKSSGRNGPCVSQLVLTALWQSCASLTYPLSRVFGLYFWAMRKGQALGRFTILELLNLVGWLSGPAFGHRSRAARMSRNLVGSEPHRWHVLLATFVSGTVLTTFIQRWHQRHDKIHLERQALRSQMLAATDFQQWVAAAKRLASLDSCHLPSRVHQQRRTRLYDEKLLRDKIDHLKAVRKMGSPREMMFALRIDLIRNIANVAKSQVWGEHHQVPDTIARYLNEVREQLHALAEWPEHELPAEEKVSFFKQTRLAYGRTALLLGGGGGLGTFHIGVVKTLFEHKMLPRVLAGSSVGSIVCALVCTKTDPELHMLLSNLDTFEIVLFNNVDTWSMSRHWLNSGSLQDIGYLIKQLRTLLGDATFLEAYERTGRILNITVCPADTNEPPRLLNYCTAPQALIWSAVAASSAFPGLFPPQNIVARNSEGRVVLFSQHSTNDTLERRWRDGSLELDLPVQALSEMFQCNHFLVSQTNPHIVPLMNLKKMLPPHWGKIMEAEIKHRCQVLQWMLPDWVPSKWLMLFTQPWEGDVTMTLPAELWQLGQTIRNPTSAALVRAVKIGERCTWEAMAAIECNCTIEATLDSCLAAITNKVRSSTMRGLGKSLPSWLHMTSMGMPSAASWGDRLPGVSGRSSHSGGSQQGDAALGGHRIPANSVEEGLADSASEQMSRRRLSGGSTLSSGQVTDDRTPSGNFVAADSFSSRGFSPMAAPCSFSALDSSRLGAGGWEASSDDDEVADDGPPMRPRRTFSLRTGLRPRPPRPDLSASVLEMAQMDCTDDSANCSGGGVRNVWGAMFGAASSSHLASGPEQGGRGVDLLQY